MASNAVVEKVLVTGASGYIATHIVKQLQEGGYRVRGTVRSLTYHKKVGPLKDLCPNAAHELELVEADLTKDDCWKDAVQGCSHVIHTASPFPTSTPRDENEIIKPAVEGTVKVLQACLDVGGVKRVVLTSSVVAISDLKENNTVPITEERWLDVNGRGVDAYSKSKTLAEKAAWDFVEKLPTESKIELAVINPSLVLGPVLCGTPGTSVEIVRRLLERDPFMVPRISFGFCDVRDVAKAHIIAMTLPEAAGNRHIIAPHNMWMLDMAQVFTEEFKDKGYNPATKVAPNFLLKMVGWFDPSIKYVSSMLGFETKFSDKRLREVLSIEPYDVKDSLIDMAYSCIERGFIVRKKGYYNPRTMEGAGEGAQGREQDGDQGAKQGQEGAQEGKEKTPEGNATAPEAPEETLEAQEGANEEVKEGASEGTLEGNARDEEGEQEGAADEGKVGA